MTDWRRVPLGSMTEQARNMIRVAPGNTYRLLGVRWYGEGPFHRETVSSESSKATRLFAVAPRQFIYNRLFAGRGSFGVVPTDLVGCFVSNEFPLFTCDESLLLPEYLSLWFQQPQVWTDIEQVSTGTTQSRNRWSEDKFRSYQVPLPPLPEQRRVVDLVGALDAQIEALDSEMQAAWRVHAGMADELLGSLDERPLGQMCSIEAKLVDPRQAQYAHLLHVGIEHIERDTGRLRTLATAEQERLVSGKHLFEPGEVIYSKIRPNLRKVAVPNFVGLCSADAYPLRPVPGLPATLLREMLLLPSVVDRVVAKSGRTKMPKVNRTELFSIPVPAGDQADWDRCSGPLEAVRGLAEALNDQALCARALRGALLGLLLSGDIEIPESYDLLLEAV